MDIIERIFNFRQSILIFISILAFALQISTVQAANRLLVWPAEEGAAQAKAKAVLPSHEIRKGKVVLSQDILPAMDKKQNRRVQVVPSKGDTLSLNLFHDIVYDVKVDSVIRNTDGTLMLNGILKNHKLRTVIITIGSDVYIITVQDMNKARHYRVSGSSVDGSGSVTEIDMHKIPPVIR